MAEVYVTHKSSGETRCWDGYQIAGRGIPDDWREATDAEIARFREHKSLEDRVAILERRLDKIIFGHDR